MSRRKSAVQRKILPDPVYQSEMIAKFVNCLMSHGKKSVAEKIMYSVMDEVKARLGQEPLELIDKAVSAIEPSVEVKSRRVGGATYPIPVEVRPSRRRSLAMRWIIEAARKRAPRAMHVNLAAEVLDILENRGGAVKKRDEVHKMAEANKAFSHFKF